MPAGSSVQHRGLPGHDLGGRRDRLGEGRDRQRLDHPHGRREGASSSRASTGRSTSTKAGGRVQAEAVNGTVTVRDASGELEASTVNGTAARDRRLVRPGQARVGVGGRAVRGGPLRPRDPLGGVGQRHGRPLPARGLRRGVLRVHLQRRDHERARPRRREGEQVDAPEGALVHGGLGRRARSRWRRSRAPSTSASGRKAALSFRGTPSGRVPRNPQSACHPEGLPPAESRGIRNRAGVGARAR